MSDNEYEFGSQLRSFLTGFLGVGQPAPGAPPGGAPGGRDPGSQAVNWGFRIDTAGLEDLYHPQEVTPFTATAGGIDNLALSSTDTFFIPGRGEFRVNFDGYFQVARAHPTTDDWTTAQVFVNLTDMKLTGNHPDLGQMKVSLNPDVVSAGQTFGPALTDGPISGSAPAACRISAGAVFESSDLGVALFNKEPILLMNDAINSIPPVEDPNGHAHIYKLPLYDRNAPDGQPIAYLTGLQYTVGNYITEATAQAFRAM